MHLFFSRPGVRSYVYVLRIWRGIQGNRVFSRWAWSEEGRTFMRAEQSDEDEEGGALVLTLELVPRIDIG